MRQTISAIAITLAVALTAPAAAGEAEVKAAQTTVQSQLEAFIAGDDALAYSFAAPNIKRMFPTPDAFMAMVRSGYSPVAKPQNYAFGEAEEVSGTRIMQRVMLLGADGKDYEALYTLELQEDGVWRITAVSMREAKTLST